MACTVTWLRWLIGVGGLLLVATPGMAGPVTAVAGGGYHTCAVTSGGGVSCWGDNTYGQLGDGTSTRRLAPVAVRGLSSGVTAVAAGFVHTCALTSGGGVVCWGYNGNGQLGDGTTTDRLTPVAVSGVSSGVTAVAAGLYHTCAVTSGRGVSCWGNNGNGQLGDGTTTQRLTPVAVSGLSSGVTAVAAGWYHTCAATSGSLVRCWGANNSGRLGDGTTTQRLTPVAVSSLSSGVTVAAGTQHTCAVTGQGGVACWGDNTSGQLGDGTSTQRLTPVAVTGLSSFAAVAAGGDRTCALTVPGFGVSCWGDNTYGQLGDGTTTGRNTPVAVSGLSSGATAVAPGVSHTCALISGGGLSCWGDNTYGQLGDGTTTARLTPVTVGLSLPSITSNPVSVNVAVGGTATFSAAAAGIPVPAVQWQVSTTSGTTWTNLTDTAPYSGTATATLTVTSVTASLTGSQYRAVAANNIGTVTSTAATLTVTVTVPTMSLDKTALVFSAINSGAAFSAKTSAQTVRLTQIGAGTVIWTAASTTPWLVVAPTSGSGSATLTIATQFASGLTASQTGSVTLTFTGAGNTAGPITVTLASLGSGTPPFGAFDTPTDGTTGVTGSIAVTGWAMDDVEVTGIRILRDPVAGEPAGTLVAIGTAVLVDGARSDVQAAYPTLPRNSRAGWGYLMLTNFLPGLGNGTFKLTAIADDADGHSTTLGSKTITCTNSTATAPTGAIDTPAQGGTVSGNVVNFGWVLSPAPRRADPPSGGTVQVVIDGAFLSTVPSGWTSRSDLTALFPAAQYPGIVNALGVAVFDSTPYANGVHTISWLVTDNLGSASGIGSRYFTVSNGSLILDPTQGSGTRSGSTVIGGSTSLPMPGAAAPGIDSTAALALAVDAAPGDGATITGRRGFDLETPRQAYAVRDGRATVQAEELDRLELQLDGIDGVDGAVTGYLRVAGGLAPLPIGAALNAQTGEFTWGPGVGFVGTYDLVFVRWSGGHAVARQDVRVVLNPKGSNRVGPQMVIDVPSSTQGTAVVGRSFVLAGWAADLDATGDRGIDTVHVWAYPATPSTSSGQAADPIWIGAATYSGARPDVAAVYGDRFLKTGYGITVQGLAPGTYDLAVFAYSTVTGGFVPAKTVRVTVR